MKDEDIKKLVAKKKLHRNFVALDYAATFTTVRETNFRKTKQAYLEKTFFCCPLV
jgi:hypothetical protein